MIIDLPLIQTILLKLPLNHNQNNIKYCYLKYKDCIKLWRSKQELKMWVTEPGRAGNRGLLMSSGSYPDSNDGFFEVGKVEKNELLDSGINPLQIGYGVDGVGLGAPSPDFDLGDGGGGKGNGGYGSGGNHDQGHGDSESSDELTGVEWWCYWQWNRAIRAQKSCRTTLHFTYTNRHQLVDLAVQMLASEVLPPSDMGKATLATIQAIEDLFPLLLQILYFPIIFPLLLSEFEANESIFAATLYGMLGASVAAAVVFSGIVIYGLWRWHGSFQNDDNDGDDTDPLV